MSASLKVRCTNCDEHFAAAPTTCPVCAATDRWEKCVVETNPVGIEPVFVHRQGVAFFAYEEAAKSGRPAPAWAAGIIPADSASARRALLTSRLQQAIAANSTFLAISGTLTNTQRDAQLRALTRQMQAMLRLQAGMLDAVD